MQEHARLRMRNASAKRPVAGETGAEGGEGVRTRRTERGVTRMGRGWCAVHGCTVCAVPSVGRTANGAAECTVRAAVRCAGWSSRGASAPRMAWIPTGVKRRTRRMPGEQWVVCRATTVVGRYGDELHRRLCVRLQSSWRCPRLRGAARARGLLLTRELGSRRGR